MSAKRFLTFCIASAIALTTLTCKDSADPLSPVEPQYAKPIKPDLAVGDPILQEFWVVPGEEADDPDVLHIVWSGGGSAVNPSVVWDHFFNGIRDDDAPVDAHYEFYYPGPPLTLGDQLPNGWFHADIPWDGSRMNEGGYEYPDYLTTEVKDEGDPFAFKLYFYDRDKRVGVATPFGVVVGGNNTFGEIRPEAEVTSMVEGDHDESVSVRSFATFKGETNEGTFAITDISASSLQCKVKAVTTGRGKNKITT